MQQVHQVPTSPASNYDFLFKFIVVGPTGVGKSSLILQFTDRRFDPKMDFTIGVEFGARLMDTAGKRIKIQLWDTAGQESFRSITNSYYRGAQSALLVYDVTRRSTFEQLGGWLDEIRHCADPHIVIMVVGNKTDLTVPREVSTEEGKVFASDRGLLFVETSAKTADNVERAFETTCNAILDKVSQGTLAIPQKSSVKLTQAGQNKGMEEPKSGGGCC